MRKKNKTVLNLNALNSKVYEACGTDDLRPAFSYLHFQDNKVFATDAHIIVVQDTALHFEGLEEKLNGKSLALPLAKMMHQRKRLLWFDEEKSEFKEMTDNYGGGISYRLSDQKDIRVPNYKAIFEGKVKVPCFNPIGFNISFMKRIENLFVWENGVKNLVMYQLVNPKSDSDIGAMLVLIPIYDNQETPKQFVVLMQVMITDFQLDKQLKRGTAISVPEDAKQFFNTVKIETKPTETKENETNATGTPAN